MSDLIDRAEAQTEIQFAARRYTVAHEAHGEGKVVWSDSLISVADAMNALRKVPSAQTCTTTDTISRQAAIDAMCGVCSDWCDEGVCKKVSELQKLPPAQQWIPCSERLPEVKEEPFYIDPITREKLYESKRVLVCGKGKDGYDYSVASHVYSTATGHGWAGAYDAEDMAMRGIIAWQPLPEPYEGGNNV